jgi:hypothetical protein
MFADRQMSADTIESYDYPVGDENARVNLYVLDAGARATSMPQASAFLFTCRIRPPNLRGGRRRRASIPKNFCEKLSGWRKTKSMRFAAPGR